MMTNATLLNMWHEGSTGQLGGSSCCAWTLVSSASDWSVREAADTCQLLAGWLSLGVLLLRAVYQAAREPTHNP